MWNIVRHEYRKEKEKCPERARFEKCPRASCFFSKRLGKKNPPGGNVAVIYREKYVPGVERRRHYSSTRVAWGAEGGGKKSPRNINNSGTLHVRAQGFFWEGGGVHKTFRCTMMTLLCHDIAKIHLNMFSIEELCIRISLHWIAKCYFVMWSLICLVVELNSVTCSVKLEVTHSYMLHSVLDKVNTTGH